MAAFREAIWRGVVFCHEDISMLLDFVSLLQTCLKQSNSLVTGYGLV